MPTGHRFAPSPRRKSQVRLSQSHTKPRGVRMKSRKRQPSVVSGSWPFSTSDGEKRFSRKHSLAKNSPFFFFSPTYSRSKGNLLRRGTARPLSTSDGEKGFSRRSSLFLSRLPSFLLPLLPLFLGAVVTSYCRIRYCLFSLLAPSPLRSRKIRPGYGLKVDAKILCQACRNFLSRPGAASAGERVRQGGQQTSPPIFSE